MRGRKDKSLEAEEECGGGASTFTASLHKSHCFLYARILFFSFILFPEYEIGGL